MNDKLRTVRLTPYRPGCGPTFTLTLWDTGRRDLRGQSYISYRLTQREPRRSPVIIFDADDFAGSPMHADDSDATVRSLLGFLTLRPGDTNREYFANYTPAQTAFCDDYAETLGAYAEMRFSGERD